MSHTEPHDEFLELCAVSTSGQLTENERKKLDEHLAVCATCRTAIKQYQSLVADVIPAIAADEVSEDIDTGPAWSQQRAETALFHRIQQADQSEPVSDQPQVRESWHGAQEPLPFVGASTWQNVWTLYSAALLLATALGICVYQVGMRRGVDSAKLTLPASIPQTQRSLEAQLSDTAHERETALAQIARRDRDIADLRQQMERQSTEMAQMKAAQDELAAAHRNDDAAKRTLVQTESDFKQKFEGAEANAGALQQKLDVLTKQNLAEQERATQLISQVNELTKTLQDRETSLAGRDELLAKDRDIRELMGARDLYVAEVYDVNRKGKTQEPYGRVFFTKGKSLIFYAYDLDREPDIRAASTFQAWGQQGPDRQKALNLGIFYIDNAAKKRWVLKLDDPNMLAQIDAVFVTVEPNGGSRKPSGTPLLFAYLKADPNHR